MKIFFIAIATILCSMTANAQIWVSTGFINASTKTTVSAAGLSTTNTEGFNGLFVGAEYELGINDIFTIAPGVEFKADFLTKNNTQFTKTALAIPVLFRAGFTFADDFRGFVGVGPQIDLGLAYTSVYKTESTTNKYNYYANDCSPFDLGLAFQLGVDYQSQYRLFLKYTLGLLNTSKINNCTMKTNAFEVGLAYKF